MSDDSPDRDDPDFGDFSGGRRNEHGGGSSRARPGGSAEPVSPARRRPNAPVRPPAERGTPTRAFATVRGAGGEPGGAQEPVPGSGARNRPPGSAAYRDSSAPGREIAPAGRPARTGRRRRVPRPMRLAATLLVLALVIVTGWFVGLGIWANGRLTHIDALSSSSDTQGTTYLIAGSDSRAGTESGNDPTVGQRADTMMLVVRAPNGHSTLVSLPRDTLVQIPGKGGYKLNAAYSLGGPALLVATVEQFTGIKVDHFVEVGFTGVTNIVDAVGDVNLCLDRNVNDPKSKLTWTKGCHDVGGTKALAFSRMRYADPRGDIGRIDRQRQLVSAVTKRVSSPAVFLNPVRQVSLLRAGTDSLKVDQKTGLVDLGRLALAFRAASGPDGTSTTIPFTTESLVTRNSGVAIGTDPAAVKTFFGKVTDGSLPSKSGPKATG